MVLMCWVVVSILCVMFSGVIVMGMLLVNILCVVWGLM